MTGVSMRTATSATPREAAIAAAYSGSHPMAMTGTAVALNGVSLSFGGIRVLRDVSFRVRSGEILAVIGPNGAGKSSVLNIISGLYQADKGTVVAGSKAFDQVPAQDLARPGEARTFQNLALFPGLTAQANIAAGLTFQRGSWLLAQALRLPGARLGVQFSLSLSVLKALPVLVLGGSHSVLGAIVAGLLIGATEKLAEVYLDPFVGGGIEGWFAYAVALVVLLVLLVRPSGLFGEKLVERF